MVGRYRDAATVTQSALHYIALNLRLPRLPAMTKGRFGRHGHSYEFAGNTLGDRGFCLQAGWVFTRNPAERSDYYPHSRESCEVLCESE